MSLQRPVRDIHGRGEIRHYMAYWLSVIYSWLSNPSVRLASERNSTCARQSGRKKGTGERNKAHSTMSRKYEAIHEERGKDAHSNHEGADRGELYVMLLIMNAIEELFEKRSTLYADRPHLPLAGEMVGFSSIPVLERYGRRHREGRKLILNTLSCHNQIDIHRIQLNKVSLLLSRLIGSPNDFRLHSRFIAAILFQITHGQQIENFDHILVKLAEQVNEDFSHVVRPGSFLVDTIFVSMSTSHASSSSFNLMTAFVVQYLPSWIPGMGFKTLAKVYREQFLRLCHEPYASVKEQVYHHWVQAKGTAPPLLAARLIEKNSDPTPAEEWFYDTAVMQFYAAGADTVR
ncbi:predicted protein [Postia placenta Mad-698-R]|nr:predicted protein [Postia placenta Mad-698-R]